MQLHQLKPIHRLQRRKKIGRGGKKGTYSGKGIKGQSSRSGRKMVPIIRELIKRYPKIRGYRAFRAKEGFVLVSLDVLDKNFIEGEIVNPESLHKKGITTKAILKNQSVKIMGSGAISKKLTVENCKVTKSARMEIEKLGGSVR